MENRTIVYYEDFGAVGDGTHDDWKEIQAAHNYANEHRKEGYYIKGKPGANYLIKDIPNPTFIMTDVDWEGVNFTVDDRGITKESATRGRIFHVAPEEVMRSLTAEEVAEIFPEGKIDKNNL